MKCGQNHKSEDTSPSWEYQTHLKKVFKKIFSTTHFSWYCSTGSFEFNSRAVPYLPYPAKHFSKAPPSSTAHEDKTFILKFSIYFTRCINSSIKCPLGGLGFFCRPAISREFFDQIKASLENTLNESLGEKHQNKNKHGHLWGRAWVLGRDGGSRGSKVWGAMWSQPPTWCTQCRFKQFLSR